MKKNIAISVRERLLNLAKAEKTDFNNMLVRFALERFLYRLSESSYHNNFLLKGALLFTLWYDMPHRATRDIDLLGFGRSDLAIIQKTILEIASIDVDDGMIFETENIRLEEIRKNMGYAGVRVIVPAMLDKARCKTQIDIGFGDAVTPKPSSEKYPVLLTDLPAPTLLTYPVYTVIAEKLHAIVLFGMANSRIKDYFDLLILIQTQKLDLSILAKAIKSTFERRNFSLPNKLPIGLTDEFSQDKTKQLQWQTFLRKNHITFISLKEATLTIRKLIAPILKKQDLSTVDDIKNE